MADTLRRFRVELEAGSTSFTKGFKEAASSADRLSKSLEPVGRGMRTFGEASLSTSQRAGKLADSIGRASTTLARSASTFGLPIGPLRALDDVADVAALGVGGLSKAVVGLETALIGPILAAAAVGAAIGTMIRNISGVGAAVDKYFSTPFADATVGLDKFSAAMGQSNVQALERQVASMKASGVSIDDLAKQYDHLDPKLKEHLGLSDKQVKAAKELAKAEKEAGEEAKRAAEAFKGLVDQLSGAEAQKKADDLARAFHVLGVEGVADIEGLRKQLEALQEQGAKITDKGLLGVLKGGKIEIPTLDVSGLDLGPVAEQVNVLAQSAEQAQQDFDKLAVAGAQAGLSAEDIAAALETAGASATEVTVALSKIPALGLGESLKKGLTDGLKGLPQVILGAIQGGGDVGKSIGAQPGGAIGEGIAKPLTEKLSGLLGKSLGGALGSIIPGLGSLLGSQLGGLLSKGVKAIGSALGIGGDPIIM